MLIFQRAAQNPDRIAVVSNDLEFTYSDLLEASARVAAYLLNGRKDLREARIAFLVPPGFSYLAVQWGIWRAGGIAVPLGLSHPVPELSYALELVEPESLIWSEGFEEKAKGAVEGKKVRLIFENKIDSNPTSLPAFSPDRKAQILFTSGTTNRPKGVVTTHSQLSSQITSLVKAWEWSENDRILNVLPLHHTHGILNVVSCALWSGACVEFQPRFEPEMVWIRFLEGGLTLFMAVPTIYHRLIRYWESVPPEQQAKLSAAGIPFRLMVSGSAALPVSVLEQWETITGQRLLERYGMTEIGMALSNPLHGERRAGTVGHPLPGVEIRLEPEPGTESGEIRVKGPNVFKEYWKNRTATEEAFEDGWFKTGDVAVLEDGYYRILGRSSVDILKSAGYKISALEIEEVLRQADGVADCAVVGIEDADLGEKICAAVVTEEAADLNAEALTEFLKIHLAPYKVPQAFKGMKDLPRNALGKVVKATVKQEFV